MFGVDGANIEDLYDAAYFRSDITAVLAAHEFSLTARRAGTVPASMAGRRHHAEETSPFTPFLNQSVVKSIARQHVRTAKESRVDIASRT
jgi:hypothetical protein